MVFNLRESVEAQLAVVRRRLAEERDRYERKRGRQSEYPLYLRLLDAEEDGVATGRMACFFFAETERELRVRRVRTALECARRLRDVDYRYV